VRETVDLLIESLTVDGDGLARRGRLSIAVPFTIPGEQVRARLGPPRAPVRAAELLEVLRPSPHRVAAPCPHFGPGAAGGQPCGGCAWQHIAYPEQLRLKTDLLARLVRDAVPGSPAPRPMAATPGPPWHFRHKVHFVVATARNGRISMGHFERASRRVVPVRDCPVHDSRGNTVAFAIRDACVDAGTRSVKGIVVRASCTTDEALATIVTEDGADTRLRAACRRMLSGPAPPSALHVNLHPREDRFLFGRETRRIAGTDRLRETLGGVSFLVSPTSFFQTNVRAAELLVQEVLAAVPAGVRVLDLYAGAGLFALPLARRGQPVLAIEENAQAVDDGRASLRISRVPPDRCRFIPASVEAALTPSRLGRFDFPAVVLDPPRQGCRRVVIDTVFGRIRPKTAVYVSCDPQSLARDLALITATGYAIQSMQPVDMFPHTPHIETVVTLSRMR
jgi:23S rRNA (uracil1939-C5)-methyltransferase